MLLQVTKPTTRRMVAHATLRMAVRIWHCHRTLEVHGECSHRDQYGVAEQRGQLIDDQLDCGLDTEDDQILLALRMSVACSVHRVYLP
jgi:hypothetical protein